MEEFKNTENCSDEILAGYLAGESVEDNKKLVEEWMNQSNENRRLFTESRKVMEDAVLYYKTRQFNSEAAWEKVSSRINTQPVFAEVQDKKQNRFRIPSLLKYAAILIFAAVTGTMVYYLSVRNNPSSLIKIQSANQVLREQVLPDGTRVALNSHSVIHFPESFTGNTREVSIEGEAFFEVVPDASRPFIITAGKATVTVLGTSFIVNAYPGMDVVEVIVKTGKVTVSQGNDSGNTGIVLTPGEKGTLSGTSRQLVKSVNSDQNYLAWKTRILDFHEATLKEVINNLEKIYPVTILTSQPAIDSLLLTARFDDQPIGEVLEVIRQTFQLDLKNNDGQYVFSHPVK